MQAYLDSPHEKMRERRSVPHCYEAGHAWMEPTGEIYS